MPNSRAKSAVWNVSLNTLNFTVLFMFCLCAAQQCQARLGFSADELSKMNWTQDAGQLQSNSGSVGDIGALVAPGSASNGPQPGKDNTKPVVKLSFISNKASALKASAPTQSQATLTNVLNGLLYNAQVTVGNNQVFSLDLDTGSADTWFRGPNCQNPSNDGSCMGPRVNIADSSIQSQDASWETNYGIGSVKVFSFNSVNFRSLCSS